MDATQSQDVKEHMHEHLHYAAGDDRASFLLAGLLAAVRGFQGNSRTLMFLPSSLAMSLIDVPLLYITIIRSRSSGFK